VLVVDDDENTVILMKQIMARAGYNVAGALSGSEALKKVPEIKPHIVLLDLLMPDMDGLETFQHLRKITNAPVIVVSAVVNKERIVETLQVGLDDYVTKPFYIPEVVARVEAVLRRSKRRESRSSRYFPNIELKIDYNSQEVSLADNRIQLTPKEFSLFSFLAERAPQVVSYREIGEQIWGHYSSKVHDRIKYLVHLTRQKLDPVTDSSQLIVNRGGIGYYLEVGADE
jgi:DNA-binding response OmpR family regulator